MFLRAFYKSFIQFRIRHRRVINQFTKLLRFQCCGSDRFSAATFETGRTRRFIRWRWLIVDLVICHLCREYCHSTRCHRRQETMPNLECQLHDGVAINGGAIQVWFTKIFVLTHIQVQKIPFVVVFFLRCRQYIFCELSIQEKFQTFHLRLRKLWPGDVEEYILYYEFRV